MLQRSNEIMKEKIRKNHEEVMLANEENARATRRVEEKLDMLLEKFDKN